MKTLHNNGRRVRWVPLANLDVALSSLDMLRDKDVRLSDVLVCDSEQEGPTEYPEFGLDNGSM